MTRLQQSTTEMLHIDLDIYLEIKIGFARKPLKHFTSLSN